MPENGIPLGLPSGHTPAAGRRPIAHFVVCVQCIVITPGNVALL